MRDASQTSELEAFYGHWRNVAMFLCGGEAGARHPGDIEPADFLGRDWWPEDDDDLDRRIRGRLPAIHSSLAHLWWYRVLDVEPIAWSGIFVAHEVNYAMALFIDELRVNGGPSLLQFEVGQAR